MQAHHVAAMLCEAAGGAWGVEPLGASHSCFTWRASRGAERLFVKSAQGSAVAMLDAEADGLCALAKSATVRVPAVVALARSANGAALVLEWLDLAPPAGGFGRRLGEAVGGLHAAACPLAAPGFGWPSDNFLGATPQLNRPSGDWQAFFRDQRLQPMLDRLAHRRDFAALQDAVHRVQAALSSFFQDGHQPTPRLIHGDLWSGNWGMLRDGTPAIYDPAVSCSDPEAELAMMELFGTPPPGFWDAYGAAAGLDPGYARRRPLYQLYHLLNHALLFGGGYAEQALRCAHRLLQDAAAR